MSERQEAIDARIAEYYTAEFDEHSRLTSRSAQGQLEHHRLLELVGARVAPGKLIDIGGGTGVNAIAFDKAGFTVTLIDPVPSHVAHASARGIHAVEGDARRLDFADASFEVALVLGPLYHLASRTDRLSSLQEAARVVKVGGWVFAAGLSRFVAFGNAVIGGADISIDDALLALLQRGSPPPHLRFPAGHFHTAQSLALEMQAAGLEDVTVEGVEGPAGIMLESIPASGVDIVTAALTLARAQDRSHAVSDLSAHLLGIGRVMENARAD